MIERALDVTIFEHVHSRQFCVTDAYLPRRAHAIQIEHLFVSRSRG